MNKLRLISHRGVLFGPDSDVENNPIEIENCITLGYDVEIDLRVIGRELFLGHDEPTYKISIEWLLQYCDHLWIHCKNKEALSEMFDFNLFNYFWHDSDDYTLTSKSYIWTYPGKPLLKNSIDVLPEKTLETTECLYSYNRRCFGVCSDYIGIIKNI